MNRTEFVRRLVLMEISDDFENVDQVILPQFAKDGSRCGLKIERSEIVDALAGLIEDGLAKAYDLSAAGGKDPFSTELQGMPAIDLVEENFKIYFSPTKKGMDFQIADDTWWPFDDEDNLRPDWRLDSPKAKRRRSGSRHRP